jgi:hypothetical protein
MSEFCMERRDVIAVAVVQVMPRLCALIRFFASRFAASYVFRLCLCSDQVFHVWICGIGFQSQPSSLVFSTSKLCRS